jgi:hypothetical protein
LIAKRMGISKDDVDTRLISLHQKGELDGTADRSSDSSVSGNISLTEKVLEDFERAEAEAKNGTQKQTGTPFKLAFKPAVVLGNSTASPRTARTPPTAPARPAPSAQSPPARASPSTPAQPTTAPAAEGHVISEGRGVEGTVGAEELEDDDEVEMVQP